MTNTSPMIGSRRWHSFVSDSEVPPIVKEAGHRTKPQAVELVGRFDA